MAQKALFRAGMLLLALLLLPGLVGCGAISNLVATPTSTMTQTPTPTATPRPTATFTITPTPYPLLDIFPQIGGGKLELFTGRTAIVKQDEPNCAYRGNYGIFFMASDVSWGINWKNTSAGYLDAAGFSTLTLWIRALQEPSIATIKVSLSLNFAR